MVLGVAGSIPTGGKPFAEIDLQVSTKQYKDDNIVNFVCYGKTRLPLHLKKSSWWQCSLRKEIKDMSVIATYVVYVHMLLRIVQDNTWRSSLRGSGSGKSVIDPKHCTHLYTAEDWSGLNILSCILTGGYRSRSRHCRVELQGYTHTHTTLKQLKPHT